MNQQQQQQGRTHQQNAKELRQNRLSPWTSIQMGHPRMVPPTFSSGHPASTIVNNKNPSQVCPAASLVDSRSSHAHNQARHLFYPFKI